MGLVQVLDIALDLGHAGLEHPLSAANGCQRAGSTNTAYPQATDNSEHVVEFASQKCSRTYAKGVTHGTRGDGDVVGKNPASDHICGGGGSPLSLTVRR